MISFNFVGLMSFFFLLMFMHVNVFVERVRSGCVCVKRHWEMWEKTGGGYFLLVSNISPLMTYNTCALKPNAET